MLGRHRRRPWFGRNGADWFSLARETERSRVAHCELHKDFFSFVLCIIESYKSTTKQASGLIKKNVATLFNLGMQLIIKLLLYG